MAKADDDNDLPDAAASLRLLARLAQLWRGADFTQSLTPGQWDAMRYLAAANRHSNSIVALADYLGITKGTMSQTVGLLVAKGLIRKSGRQSDMRSVTLELTESGQALLMADQRQFAVTRVKSLKPKTQKRLAQALEALVADEALRLRAQGFGTCRTCVSFREGGKGELARCMSFETELTHEEERLICVAHQAR